MTKSQSVHVIGGGLAGCEAAWRGTTLRAQSGPL